MSSVQQRPNLQNYFAPFIRKLHDQVQTRDVSETIYLKMEDTALIMIAFWANEIFAQLCDIEPRSVLELFENVNDILGSQLGSTTVRYVQEKLRRQKSQQKKKVSVTVFDVDELYQLFKDEIYKEYPVDKDTVTAIMLMVEYCILDILMLTGMRCHRQKRTKIKVNDVNTVKNEKSPWKDILRANRPTTNKLEIKADYETIVKLTVKAEAAYIRSLDMIMKVYLELCDPSNNVNSPFTESLIQDIFEPVTIIYDFAANFHVLLEEAAMAKPPRLGAVFSENALIREFDTYEDSANGYIIAQEMIDSVCTENAEIIKFLNEKDFLTKFKLVLPQLLLKPISHFFHYVEVIKVLMRLGQQAEDLNAADKKDFEDLRLAWNTLSGIHARMKQTAGEYMDVSRRSMLETPRTEVYKDFRELTLTEVQAKICDWEGGSLNSNCTRVAREGVVDFFEKKGARRNKKERYLYVLDGLVLNCKIGSNNLSHSYTLREKFILNQMQVIAQDDAENSFELRSLDGRKSVLLGVKTKEEQEKWVQQIQILQETVKLERMLDDKLKQDARHLDPALKLDASVYPFGEEDSDKNILLEKVNQDSNTPPIVKGGSLIKLIERLTFPVYIDTKYLNDFLLTYRSFCTPAQLLDQLMVRYNIPDPPNLNPVLARQFKNSIKIPVRIRVFNVLRNWVEKSYHDIKNDPETLLKLVKFVNREMENGDTSVEKMVQACQRTIAKRKEKTREKTLVFTEEPPSAEKITVSVDKLDIMNIPHIEIARQMTLIESDLFRAIPPSELVNWPKTKKHDRPNGSAMIEATNYISKWISSTIVETDQIVERVEIIARFVDICGDLFHLNNFNGLMAVIAVFNSAAISRLKATWAQLGKTRKEQFDYFNELLHPFDNFMKYRSYIHSVNPPCIPFFGMYLTDLVFIDEIPDYIKDSEPKLINFSKRRKVAATISEIQQYQQQPYNLTFIPDVRSYIMDEPTVDDPFVLSLDIEPRNVPVENYKDKNGAKKRKELSAEKYKVREENRATRTRKERELAQKNKQLDDQEENIYGVANSKMSELANQYIVEQNKEKEAREAAAAAASAAGPGSAAEEENDTKNTEAKTETEITTDLEKELENITMEGGPAAETPIQAPPSRRDRSDQYNNMSGMASEPPPRPPKSGGAPRRPPPVVPGTPSTPPGAPPGRPPRRKA